jgi:hydroxymethylpyrimidine pyrophosphatase-like HAD family hydrolase
MKNLIHIQRAGSSIVKSMSGIDPSWKSTNELSGYHPLLGEVVFSPTSRVSLINPNLLVNDGWKLCTFSGRHGDVVKLYSRQFDENTYFIEFIMNINGQLIANDPADDPSFKAPSQHNILTLGSLHSLREYLVLNHTDMMEEYKARRDEFFASATDESQNHYVSFEGVSDSDNNEDTHQFYNSSSSSNEGRQYRSNDYQSEASNTDAPVSSNP